MVGDIFSHVKVYFKNIRSITLVSYTLFLYLFVLVQYVGYALWLGTFLVILKCILRIYEVSHLLAIHSSCICSSSHNRLGMLCGWGHFWSY